MAKYLSIIFLSLPLTVIHAINYQVKFTNFSRQFIQVNPSSYNTCIKYVDQNKLINLAPNMSTTFIITDSNNWLSHCYFAAKTFTWDIIYAHNHDQLILKHWEYGSWLTNLHVLRSHKDKTKLIYSISCNGKFCQGQYDYLGNHDISIKVAILGPNVYQCKIPATI